MAHEVSYLKEMYKTLNVAVQEESVSECFERFSAVEVGGERYGSSKSRSIRSSYILASWVSTGGLVNTSASEPRAGCVKFYLANPFKFVAKIFLNNWAQQLSFLSRGFNRNFCRYFRELMPRMFLLFVL